MGKVFLKLKTISLQALCMFGQNFAQIGIGCHGVIKIYFYITFLNKLSFKSNNYHILATYVAVLII